MKDKEKQIKFSVIDNKTGEYPDLYNIALKEDWAKGLLYCDMEGFSINEDGQLILSDECGKFVYCPGDRFTVVFEDSVVLSSKEYEKLKRVEAEKDRLYEMKLDLENQLIEKGWTDYEGADEIEKRVSKETAEKIYLQAKAIVDLTKLIVQNREYIHSREYIHIDALKEIIKNCGIEIKE